MKKTPTTPKTGENPKLSAFILGTLKTACIIFTLLSALILIFNLIYSSVNGDSGKYFNTTLFLFSILPFSLTVSLAHNLLAVISLGIYRWIAHVFLCNGGFFLIILLPYRNNNASPTSILFIMLLFIIVYAIGTVIWAIISDKTKRKKADDREYVGMFTKKQ